MYYYYCHSSLLSLLYVNIQNDYLRKIIMYHVLLLDSDNVLLSLLCVVVVSSVLDSPTSTPKIKHRER